MLGDMPLPDQDSAVGHSFGLELDGVDIRLLEVQNLVLSIFGIESGEDATSRQAGRAVTLVRPLVRGSTFAEWAHQAKTQGMAAGRSATLVVFATDGSPVARYHLENAWPSRLEIGSFTSGDDTLVVERLTVTYDDVEAG
jgi:phage tail-like protein